MAPIIPITDVRSATSPVARAPCASGGTRRRPARRPRRHARPAAARPAHLGHRPLQFPLRLLHAARRCSDATTSSCRTAELLTFEEIVRVARVFVGARRARRSASPAASRCCAATSSAWSTMLREACRPSTSRSPPTARCSRGKARALARRGPRPRHGEPRFARRRDVPRDERRRFPGRARCSRASTPRRRRGSRRSRSTWWSSAA